jgi:nucleoside 2-deoxyribosyltransferase
MKGMTDPNIKCLICQYHKADIRQIPSWGYDINCPRCGPYQFYLERSLESFAEDLQNNFMGLTGRKLYEISAFIRERYENGQEKPGFNDKSLLDVTKNLPIFNLKAKQRYLLSSIEKRFNNYADSIKLVLETDYPLAWAENEKEFEYILNVVQDRNLIRWSRQAQHPNPVEAIISLTYYGWDYLDENRSQNRSESRNVFVAMSFKSEYESIWEDAIKPAITEIGFNPIRIDKIQLDHDERIDDAILNKIAESRLLVAEFTGVSPGVYFEAGFALGKGIPFILTVSDKEIGNVHFDTRQFPHIVWENSEDLRKKLIERIRFLVGNQ